MSDTDSAEDGEWGTASFTDRPDLYRELQRVDDTKHFALFYQSRQERLDAALAFVKLGLESGERCLYITDESTPEEVYDGLETLGAESTVVRDSDRLRIASTADIYLDGGFDPSETANLLAEAVEESLTDGFEGFRVTGETGWVHEEDIPVDQLVEYETTVEHMVPAGGLTALCQYDLRQLDDTAVAAMLKIHPTVIYRHRVCENPYYSVGDGSEIGGDPGISATQLLTTMFDLATANDAIRQREQRVAVLNRVLRHNLRNEMNVIQSHADLLQETADTTPQESIEAILSTTTRLLSIAEDAKRVEKSISGAPERMPIDLVRVVDEATERVRKQYPSVTIGGLDAEAVWVEASDELEFALAELFKTLAALAGDGASIDVVYDDACSTHALRCIRVRCRNAHLPEAEIEALTQGRETQLTHGSGLGLWLVNWIVELSGGELTFSEGDEPGDEVVLSFIAA